MFEDIRRITKQKKAHSIVKAVKLLCLDADTSIPKLEKELGLGAGTIYNWDRSSPTTEAVVKVALHFKVSTDYLLGLVSE